MDPDRFLLIPVLGGYQPVEKAMDAAPVGPPSPAELRRLVEVTRVCVAASEALMD